MSSFDASVRSRWGAPEGDTLKFQKEKKKEVSALPINRVTK